MSRPEVGSPTEPGAQYFSFVTWPVSSMGLLVPTINISLYQDYTAVADFKRGFGDANSDHHACTVNTLPTELSPRQPFKHTFANVKFSLSCDSHTYLMLM